MFVSTTVGLLMGEAWFRYIEPGFVFTYPPGLFLPDEVLERRLAPSFTGQFRAARPRVKITTNSQGFRDLEHSWQPRNDVRRVLVVGDSFTLGPDVSLEHLYFRRLETKLNEMFTPQSWEVIAMGVGGYGTAHELELLRRWLPRIEPDAVVIQFFENDIDDSWRLTATRTRGPYVRSNGQRTISHWVGRLSASRSYFVSTIGSLLASRLTSCEGRRDRDCDVACRWRLTRALFEQIATLVHGRGSIGFVLVIPDRDVVSRGTRENRRDTGAFQMSVSDSRSVDERVAPLADENGLVCVSLLRKFRSCSSVTLYNPHDPHLSSAGHKVASEVLFQSFLEVIDHEARGEGDRPGGID